ncbi:MAG: hypothetical protein ABIQ36_10815, partial [Rhodanobacter sp.]
MIFKSKSKAPPHLKDFPSVANLPLLRRGRSRAVQPTFFSGAATGAAVGCSHGICARNLAPT